MDMNEKYDDEFFTKKAELLYLIGKHFPDYPQNFILLMSAIGFLLKDNFKFTEEIKEKLNEVLELIFPYFPKENKVSSKNNEQQ